MTAVRAARAQSGYGWDGVVKLVKRKEKEKLLPVVRHCGWGEGWAPTLQAGKPGPEV